MHTSHRNGEAFQREMRFYCNLILMMCFSFVSLEGMAVFTLVSSRENIYHPRILYLISKIYPNLKCSFPVKFHQIVCKYLQIEIHKKKTRLSYLKKVFLEKLRCVSV